MSRWFDILYRRPQAEAQPAPQARSTSNHPLGAASDERPLKSTNQPTLNQGRIYEKPGPLNDLPSRWSLEIQKIVIHLRPEIGDSNAPHHIVFSGMQRRAGVTTISYLVAHHLATERYDQRVLYVDFSPNLATPIPPGMNQTLKIGDAIEDDRFADIRTTLTSLSIRPGGKHSVSVTSGWLNELMVAAKRHFDWIIFDCPPFFTTPETYSAAKECDGVVLLMKSGESRHPAVKALVADLDSLGIQIIGTVLNFRQYPIPKWLLKYV